MRLALALHGYFNNREDPESGENGARYICDILLNKYNVDVFLHSWEKDKSPFLLSFYQPIDYLFEDQIDFQKVMQENGISQEYFDENFLREYSPYAACKISSTLSFLYSRKKALELVYLYEEAHEFQYDIVITARFDLGQRDKFGKWKYYVSQMNFDPELDMQFTYSAMWDQLNAGYADQWFFSNSNNMRLLSMAYDAALNDYFKAGSKYEKAVTTGWPDSKVYDGGFYDPGQFSNEKLKPFRDIRNLVSEMKYPKWQCINNHILYKWHMIAYDLYEKSKFV